MMFFYWAFRLKKKLLNWSNICHLMWNLFSSFHSSCLEKRWAAAASVFDRGHWLDINPDHVVDEDYWIINIVMLPHWNPGKENIGTSELLPYNLFNLVWPDACLPGGLLKYLLPPTSTRPWGDVEVNAGHLMAPDTLIGWIYSPIYLLGTLSFDPQVPI